MNTRLFDLQSKSTAFTLGLVLVFVVLIPIYLSTLQTIPNGAEHYYALDVGETQIVLNSWGTLHATGYPLYVIVGNILVKLFRGLGIAPAVAPGVVSLIWGLIALALIYTLAYHLTGQVILSAAITILFGLTRTVWIHNAIAEIYSFGLMILALLLLIALWPGESRHRIYWLAFIGGIGVFHHRALIMVAPALIYAVWPEFTNLFVGTRFSVSARKIFPILLLGLLGFLPYLYLPLRANAGAAWVYGEPGTWVGFWDQFTGREANRFIGIPQTPEALLANFDTVNAVLITDLTLPGLLLGILGLALGIYSSKYRRAAVPLALSALAAYLFHVLYYTDILSALILPILLSFAFGWLFLLNILFSTSYSPLHSVGDRRKSLWERGWGWGFTLLLTFIFSVLLIAQNLPFITSLTRDPTGLETIALVQTAPPGSTLMLAWGPRYFAAGFAKDVLGDLPDIQLVDHQADFQMLIRQRKLVTPDYTFYNQPANWWQERLGTKVYLRTPAPYLVQIDTQPEIMPGAGETMTSIESRIECLGAQGLAPLPESPQINLYVTWYTPDKPEQDLSVFVHLLDQNGSLLAQADQSAPVYGWRPLTTWEKDEIVRDIYPLPYLSNASSVRFGLYRQQETGEFVNEVEYVVAVDC